MKSEGGTSPTQLDIPVWVEARKIVEAMYPHEASTLPMLVEDWPAWAKRDIERIYAELRAKRSAKP